MKAAISTETSADVYDYSVSHAKDIRSKISVINKKTLTIPTTVFNFVHYPLFFKILFNNTILSMMRPSQWYFF